MKGLLLAGLLYSSLIPLGLDAQGPYAPAAGQTGTTAIHRDSSIIESWASACSVTRGYLDIQDKAQGFVTTGTPNDGVGYADGAAVSLGDSGIAIMEFPYPITNQPGPDFAVFENSFSDTFLELAEVYVSSDGVNYIRFPSHSLTPDTTDIGGFGSTDPTDLNNLAGKYRAQYGTPFDLVELTDSSHLDIMNVTHLKLVDVVGTVDSNFSAVDTAGNKIVDPYPTPFPSGGFDLDGVAVLSPMTTDIDEESQEIISLYPVPASDALNIQVPETADWVIYSVDGKPVISGAGASAIQVDSYSPGLYLLVTQLATRKITRRFVVR